MPNNIPVDVSSGDTVIAATDLSGVKYPKVQLADLSGNPYVASGGSSAVTLLAGDNHVGLVGGVTVNTKVTPTVTASAYSSGKVIGGVISVANAFRSAELSGILHRLYITSKNNIQPTLHIYLFDTNPSNGTYTDQVALTWNATDFGYVVGCIQIVASNWVSDGTKAVADLPGLNEVLLSTSTTLYALAVIQGAFTPGSTSDFTIGFNILQD